MDPKLKPALDEIKAVLKKHDVAGVVILASVDHTDYVVELETTWSCAFREGPMLRIRSKLVDYPSRAAQKKCQEDTVGAFIGFLDVMGSIQKGLERLVGLISESVEITHVSRREPD